MAVLRLFGLVLGAQTIVFLCLWAYLRAGTRDRLAARWRETRPPMPEFRYVANGLEAERTRMRNRLVLWVYVLPLAATAAAIWYFDYR